MFIVVASTLPHVFSILPLISYYDTHAFGYINVILLSTLFSILYHVYEEQNRIIELIDYSFAGLWGLYDVYMGYTFTNNQTIATIVFANALSLFLNIQSHDPYYHSFWHFINAYKSYYVSTLISDYIGLTEHPY
jgi:hypothetical protein